MTMFACPEGLPSPAAVAGYPVAFAPTSTHKPTPQGSLPECRHTITSVPIERGQATLGMDCSGSEDGLIRRPACHSTTDSQ